MKLIKPFVHSMTLMLLTSIYLCACSGTEVGNPEAGDPTPIVNMNTFGGDDELETYLKDQYASSVLKDEILGASPAAGAPDAGGGAADFSETNLQEAGVDESDLVKTDGAHFYISRGGSVSVVGSGDSMTEIARIDIDGYVDSLYLHGTILVVLYTPAGKNGEPWGSTPPPLDLMVGMPYWLPVNASAGVGFYDVADPSGPMPLKSMSFDGRLVSSRIVNGRLHLVQQFIPDLPPLTLWCDGSEAGCNQVIEDNRLALDGIDLDRLLPHFRDAADGAADVRTVGPGNLYYPTPRNGGTIATVVTFDLDDPALNFDTIGVVADAHLVYASTEALYLLAQQYVYPTDASRGSGHKLVIQKFDLGAQGVQYAGGGQVDGWILNQFSLGEYQGVLRIALTANPWSDVSRRSNNILCLQMRDKQLAVIGQLENLAPGEHIYAARFMGKRGFLVTFVKVDPLFTIDLSDPTQPRVAGELKVPGYADYIHPYGDNHLITIGKDAVAEGNITWYQGMQMSIFDVTDFDNPTLLHKALIGDRGTESEALRNHKAFTFWASRELLAIPVRLFEHASPPPSPQQFGENVFNGLLVYKTSVADGFEYLGRMGDDTAGQVPSIYRPWMRGIFSGPTVYSVTPDRVLSAQTDDIQGTIQTYDLPVLP